MARQNINNGETGLVVRTKLNENYTELYDADGEFVDKTNAQTIAGEKTFSDNLQVNAQAHGGSLTVSFSASQTFNINSGNNQKMPVTASTNVGISDELPGTVILELEIDSGASPTITPNANLGTVMDGSSDFINADNDINIITIYINPDGAKRYTVNTITA